MSDYVAREAEVSTTTSTTTSGTSKTTTTTIGATYDNGVVDVNIQPYIRGLAIYFRATGMRPNRRVWFFFDNQNITNYIVDTNELYLESNNDISIFSPTTGGFKDSDTITDSANTQNSAILVSQTRQFDDDDDGSEKPRLRKLRIVGLTNSFFPGQTIRGSKSLTSAVVRTLTIGGGNTLDQFFSNTSSNTIILPKYTKHIANNYWGVNGANTITLIPYKHYKKGAGDPVIAYIGDGTRGFDNVTRTLYLSNTHSQLANNVDDEVSILPYLPETEEQNSDVANTIAWTIDGINHKTGQQGLGWYTDAEGTIDGIFIVPPGRFKIGNRIMRIIDNSINDITDCTTRSEREFSALGLQQTKQDVTILDTSHSSVIRERSGGSGGGGGSSGGGGNDNWSPGGGGDSGSSYSSDSGSTCGVSYGGGSVGGLGLASGGSSYSGGYSGGDLGSSTFG